MSMQGILTRSSRFAMSLCGFFVPFLVLLGGHAGWADEPDFSDVDDILLGQRYLLRVDNLVVSAFVQTTIFVDNSPVVVAAEENAALLTTNSAISQELSY
jgi:hypothetical protein